MTTPPEHDPVLLAILALLVERRPDNPETPKIEVLLNRCGLSNEVIGQVLGKKGDTVRVALARALSSESPAIGRNRRA